MKRDVEECIIADMDYSRPMDAVRRNVTHQTYMHKMCKDLLTPNGLRIHLVLLCCR